MKTKLLLSILLSIGIVSFSSCEDTERNEGSGNNGKDKGDNQYVNNWIMNTMSESYLWNDKLPASKNLDFAQNPKDFFNDLLAYEIAWRGGSAFSRIEGTHASVPKSESSSDLGFEYVPIYWDNTRTKVVNIVVFVKTGSLAAKKGLRRGNLITKVDGAYLTANTWFSALAQNKSSYSLEIAVNGNALNNNSFTKLTVEKTPNFDNTPILMHSIYVEGAHKTGYVVYNSFESGSRVSMPYDVALMNVFQEFKDAGITDIILDFRYNGGGYVSSAQAIASALVPDRSSRKVFEVQVNNKGQSSSYNFIDNVVNMNGKSLIGIPRLGDQLNNIYVIGTGNTASASEMVINTLRPYMQDAGKSVYLIGEQTLGKNVGSEPFYKKNDKRNTYVMWPITFRSHNKLYPAAGSSDYEKGFKPNIAVDDFMTLGSGLKDMGDKDEIMLRAALDKIQGKSSIKTAAGQSTYVVLGSSLERKHGNNMYISRDEIENKD